MKIRAKTEDGPGPDSIHAKPIWQRLAIIAAGVAMKLGPHRACHGALRVGGRMMLEASPDERRSRTARSRWRDMLVPGRSGGKAGVVEAISGRGNASGNAGRRQAPHCFAPGDFDRRHRRGAMVPRTFAVEPAIILRSADRASA